MSRHKAIFKLAGGTPRDVFIYLSPVTITIEIPGANGSVEQIDWLVKDIVQLDRLPHEWIFYSRDVQGAAGQLLIRDEHLQNECRRLYRGESFFKNRVQWARKSVYVQLGFLLLLFAGLASLAYFWLLPFLGERVALQFSKETEISLGNELYNSTVRSMKVDSNRTAIMNRFYATLNYSVGYPVHVTVVESDEINAFAIPGGHMVVYSGILERMRMPEELAALLGHEATHISQRHSLRNLFRSLGRSILLLLVLGNESGLIAQLAGQLDALKGLEYSRALEYEADEKGMALMSQSRIDASGMLRLMEMLQKETHGTELPGFLQTHPLHADRINAIQKNLARLAPGQPMSAVSQQLFHDLYE